MNISFIIESGKIDSALMHLSWNNCVLLADFERLHKYTSVIMCSSTRQNRQNSALFTDTEAGDASKSWQTECESSCTRTTAVPAVSKLWFVNSRTELIANGRVKKPTCVSDKCVILTRDAPHILSPVDLFYGNPDAKKKSMQFAARNRRARYHAHK